VPDRVTRNEGIKDCGPTCACYLIEAVRVVTKERLNLTVKCGARSHSYYREEVSPADEKIIAPPAYLQDTLLRLPRVDRGPSICSCTGQKAPPKKAKAPMSDT
jgi:hypothetical protein